MGGKNKEVGEGTKFKIGKLILDSQQQNIIVAARCRILRLKAPNSISTGGAHSAPTDPLAGFKGAF